MNDNEVETRGSCADSSQLNVGAKGREDNDSALDQRIVGDCVNEGDHWTFSL